MPRPGTANHQTSERGMHGRAGLHPVHSRLLSVPGRLTNRYAPASYRSNKISANHERLKFSSLAHFNSAFRDADRTGNPARRTSFLYIQVQIASRRGPVPAYIYIMCLSGPSSPLGSWESAITYTTVSYSLKSSLDRSDHNNLPQDAISEGLPV
jgi:hypothetical protein